MQITHRRILNIAIPIVLANITVPLLSLVDTGVVGQIDSPVPIAAVGMGGLILSTTYWFFGFLRMGTTGLASQAFGAQDSAEVTAILTRVLLLGGAGGLVIIALQIPLSGLPSRSLLLRRRWSPKHDCTCRFGYSVLLRQ